MTSVLMDAAPRRKRQAARRKLKVLFLPHEYRIWRHARCIPYPSGIGFEEGLAANGVRSFTLPLYWLDKVRPSLDGQKFDQVWFEARHTVVDEEVLDWLTSLAPVRVAFFGESVNYHPEEHALSEDLRTARPRLEKLLRYATHIVAVDEVDVAEINRRGPAKAMWWIPSVPRRFVRAVRPPSPTRPVVFAGAVYGERARFLTHPELKVRLSYFTSPETRLRLHLAYDFFQRSAERVQQSRFPAGWGLALYLFFQRRLRRTCYRLYLAGLRATFATVNLPHFAKCYSSRVVESMAAGRPVISWRVPDRPQNLALFEPEQEILLYPKNDPVALADQIRRLRSEPSVAHRIAVNASVRSGRSTPRSASSGAFCIGSTLASRLATLDVSRALPLAWLACPDSRSLCHQVAGWKAGRVV